MERSWLVWRGVPALMLVAGLSVAAPAGSGLPRNGQLFGVSCTSARACMAVGSSATAAGTAALAERWDGRSWRLQALPRSPGTLSSLDGVSCSAADACTAVGTTWGRSLGATIPLVERWNGDSWQIQATPRPDGIQARALGAVSCPSATACTAVGSYVNSLGHQVPLAEHWDGTAWRVEPAPSPPTTYSYLGAVSCAAATDCTAVGAFYPTSAGILGTLAEAWDGTSWRIQATPNPAGGTGTTLGSVSCTTPGQCTAVGFDARSGRIALTVVETWDGKSWKIQDSPTPANTYSSLEGVACATANACTAVGSFSPAGSGNTSPLAERWNGTSWKTQAVPNPHGSTGTDLPAVSCAGARWCLAVGSKTAGPSSYWQTLAEVWSGATWKIQPTPEPSAPR